MFNKLRKLIARALGEPAETSGCKHGQSRRFVPAVEALESRWVPATFQVNGLVALHAEAVIGEAAKVSTQDFHFVIKQDKASPKLMAHSDEGVGAPPTLDHADSALPSIGENLMKGKPTGDDHIKITLTDVLISG